MGQVFINATVFSVHGSCMRYLQPDGGTNNVLKSSMAGLVAGVVQSFICSPMELVKLKMQVQGIGKELNSPLVDKLLRKQFDARNNNNSKVTERYRGPWDTTKLIYKQNGINGLSRGLMATIGREGPSFAVYFGSYDLIRQNISRTLGVPLHQLGSQYLFVSGGIAGCLTWLSTYPFDVLKTRIQLDTQNMYSGIWDCFKKIVRHEGGSVMFRGLSSALYRAFVTNAFTLPTVTLVLQYWDDKQRNNYSFR